MRRPTPDSVTFRLATAEDAAVETFDNTKLTAGATCPTWGITRYQMHKTVAQSSRAMALECGSVMHDAFAMIRLVQLLHDFNNIAGRDPAIGKALFQFHGLRMFKQERLMQILEQASGNGEFSPSDNVKIYATRAAVAVLETSDYYDDPSDKKRTIANMEDSLFAYVSKWDWKQPIWVRDITDPTSDVGIEIPFDLLVTWQFGDAVKQRRFTGKIDGIRVVNGVVRLEENKTASRLNEAWSQPFYLNSQPTGYMMAASVFSGETIRQARIMGLCIPLPKSYDAGGYLEFTVHRTDNHITDWLRWFDFIASSVYEDFAYNPSEAPRFTHSCGRYFRPCSMIPFCDVDEAEQKLMLDEMITEEWSPLADEGEKAND